MEYRRVGETGWDVSALSLGCMRLKDEATAVAAADWCGLPSGDTMDS